MIQVIRETHDPDPRWIEEIALAGGRNRYGDPNYRIIWGGSRLDWIGGEWTDWTHGGVSVLRRVVEHRRVPKYPDLLNYWLVERWCAPEEYGSPLVWKIKTTEFYGARSIEALGPYPARGDYELTMSVSRPCAKCVRLHREDDCKEREFQQLTLTMAEYVGNRLRIGREATALQIKQARERAAELSQKTQEAAIEEILGMDPAPISRERRDYLERVVVPQLDIALARAARQMQGRRPRPSRYPVSAMQI